MNRRERLEEILGKHSRGAFASGTAAALLLDALAAQEKVIEAAREAWQALQDIEWALKNPDMGGTHYGKARDKAEATKPVLRAALAVYDSFMEGSET